MPILKTEDALRRISLLEKLLAGKMSDPVQGISTLAINSTLRVEKEVVDTCHIDLRVGPGFTTISGYNATVYILCGYSATPRAVVKALPYIEDIGLTLAGLMDLVEKTPFQPDESNLTLSGAGVVEMVLRAVNRGQLSEEDQVTLLYHLHRHLDQPTK